MGQVLKSFLSAGPFENVQFSVVSQTKIMGPLVVYTLKKNLDGNWDLLVIFHAFVVICWLFTKLTLKKSFRNIIKVSNGLDPD